MVGAVPYLVWKNCWHCSNFFLLVSVGMHGLAEILRADDSTFRIWWIKSINVDVTCISQTLRTSVAKIQYNIIEQDAQNHLYRTSWVIWYPCNMAVEYLSWEIYLMLWNIHIFGLYVFWCSVVPGDDFCGEGTITNKSVKIKDQGLRLFFIHYLDITRSFIMFSLLLLKSRIIIYYIILMYIFTNIFYLDNHLLSI